MVIIKHLAFAPALEDDEHLVSPIVFLALACYLAIVGGITRFRPGISTKVQRGWFVSWAVTGTLFGLLPVDETVKSTGFVAATARVSLACIAGMAAFGGILAMIQQYLHLFQC